VGRPGSGSPASSVQPPEGIVIYTVKNLRDVRDAAPDAGVDATQVMRFAQGDLDAVQTGVSLMAVKPGRRQVIAHRHDEAEEVYVILSGSGRIKLDDDIVEVGPMDAIRVAPTVTRALEGGPEGIEYLAVGRHHDGDGAVQPIEEFWP
jgi:mannose-6-phosphate isomerase-like protein (cupin superfamily)